MLKKEISLGDLDELGNLDDKSKWEAGGLREELNVNSPKSGGGLVFATAAPADLITQVNQEDEGRQIEMAKAMVRRIDDEEVSQKKIVSYEQSPKPRNYGNCLTCWLCCGLCSGKRNQYTKQNEDSSGYDNDNGSTGSNSSNAWDAVETKVVDQTESPEVDYVLNIIEPENDWLLPSPSPEDQGRKCLVLDLDETLVHSCFEPIECSFSLTITLDETKYGVYVLKRPYVDEFIAECAKMYELVIFTASLPEYANPVIDTLDKNGLIKHRLFRGDCVFYEEQFYVKDLSKLGRNMKDCIIIDNSMLSFLFNPTNAIACTSWFDDKSDTELRDLLPVLSGQLLATNDVRTILDGGNQSCEWLIKQYGDKNNEIESSSSY